MRKIPLNLTNEELRQRFNKEKLEKYFPNEAVLIRYLYDKEKLFQWEIGVVLGYSLITLRRKMKSYGIKTRSNAEAQLIRWGQAHLRHDFDGDSRKKCYYMGFIKGDCNAWKVNKNGQTIELKSSSTIPEQIELFERLFRRYGYVRKCRPYKFEKVHISVDLNLESFTWLLGLGDCIPSLALVNDENFFAFLGGYTDAEGHIGVQNGYALFHLSSYDKTILHQIHKRLIKLGIEFPKPRITKPKGTIFISLNGNEYRTNQDCWCLATTRKESLLKLFERLGSHLRHPKRIAGMKAAIRNIEERNARQERARQRKERFKELLVEKEELLRRFPDEAELIRYLYNRELLSKTAIGEIFGYTSRTVGSRMKRYGIKARTLSEAKRIDCGYEPMV